MPAVSNKQTDHAATLLRSVQGNVITYSALIALRELSIDRPPLLTRTVRL